ncbi:MAG: hypothetical protein STSR0008_15290 [Ignavibacterium sp.]
MILKNYGLLKSHLSHFDLLGNDEVALSKAFAFLLSNDSDVFYHFIKFLGLSFKNTTNNFRKVIISTEKFRDEGRTDIELYSKNKFHIIIECKVRKNKVTQQRTQYLDSFIDDVQKKILCFITQERDSNKQIANGVIIRNTDWFEIIDSLNKPFFERKQLVKEFKNFSTKNYKMNMAKEVLIQDLKNPTEVRRFKEFNVYRRDATFGSPLYFAPYFTRGGNQPEGEGISYLSKILGILTLRPSDINNFEDDLKGFNRNLTQSWINGVNLGNNQANEVHTFYFLDNPLRFPTPLKKVARSQSRNWIGSMIPKNRCVSFSDFIKHIPEIERNII